MHQFFTSTNKVRPLLLLFCWFLSTSAGAQSWSVLYDKADSLFSAGKYADALTGSLQSLQRAEQDSGRNSVAYASSLHQIGVITLSKGEPKEAESWLLKAKENWVALAMMQTEEYAQTLRNLGTLYRTLHQFDDGVKVLNEALLIRGKLKGKDSPDYADILNSIGSMYSTSGDYGKAEGALREAYRIYKKTDKGDIRFVSVLNNLGVVYQRMEDFVRAEPYLEEAVEVRRKLLGTEHPLYGTSLGNLLLLYQEMGNYQKAIDLGWQLVRQRERIMPATQLHAYALNNLAENYRLAGKYNDQPIDTLYTNALSIIEQKLGDTHTDYSGIQNNLALLYLQQKKYEQAALLYRQISKNVESKLGKRHPDYTAYRNNLGQTYIQLKQFSLADSLLKESLSTVSQTMGTTTQRYAVYLCRYAQSLIAQQRHQEAIDSLFASEQSLEKLLERNFLSWSDSQRNDYTNTWNTEFATYFSEAWRQKQNEKATGLAYQAALFVKGVLLNEYIRQVRYLNGASDLRLRQRYQSWSATKSLVTAQYNLPLAKRNKLDSLEAQTERLEKDLARQAAPFRQAQQAIRTGWQDVQKALKPTEATVEFVHFQFHNGYEKTDSVLYMALVLRPGWSAPRLVPLTHETKLADLLRQSVDEQPSLGMLRSRSKTLTNTGQLAQGEQLYRLVWQPIDSLLRGVRQVWVSASGLLHKVSLAALPYPGQTDVEPARFLADQYVLRHVGSTRAVALASETPSKTPRMALLYGGITYQNSAGTTDWPALPGTQQEVVSIGKIWGASATVVTGQQATRAHLDAHTVTPPHVLHLATHAFFRSTTDQRTDFTRSSTDPVLTRSGIVMAQTRATAGKRVDSLSTTPDNGIVTGLELANLNLAGTELVVLSACETGLGDIRGSEGVFGLQRAVKMAGAKNLILSLWPVPDGPTSQFMIAFYQNWRGSTPVSTAFARTQESFKKRYTPAVWAAFVLIE